jgi:hypothetical protein
LVYYRNSEIDYILKELGRIILLIASDAVDLIVVIVKKVRDGIATTAIDLEISFKQTFISNYVKKVETISIYLIKNFSTILTTILFLT